VSYVVRHVGSRWHGSPSPLSGPACLDIETTGLDPRRHHVTVVGVMTRRVDEGVLHQFFVDDPSCEARVLKAAAELVQAAGTLLTYNGTRFDVPFLAERSARWGLVWPLRPQIDLLPLARKWNGPVEDFSLQTVTAFFGLARGDGSSGADMVGAYHAWIAEEDHSARQLVLNHNAADIVWLPELLWCLQSREGANPGQP
jgi:uncharacterized protein YprB with RNaseH-like and TPR domain